jgi:hypothetical protein
MPTIPHLTPELLAGLERALVEQEQRTRAAGLSLDWWREYLPRVLPAGWRREEVGVFRHRDGLLVLVSGGLEQDNRRWLHASMSKRQQLPSWSDVREVKDLFIGRDRYAYQVLPPPSHYVNFHPNVLHLWACLDGEPLPDFTRGAGIL